MATEDEVRDELMALLRFANKTAIADALGLTAQAVINWANGRNTSPRRLEQVRALYGLTAPDATERAHPGEPEWAEALEALEARIVGELHRNRRLIEALPLPERLAQADQLIERLEAQLRQRGAAPLERTGRSGPGAGSPQAQAGESPPVPNGER